ncbi:MAG: hypothetical protein DI585_06055 [Pseudomonas fluorescens]|nr:MAG: hypothetical protein DI585_06055 [Pseudomonas fluorescens]
MTSRRVADVSTSDLLRASHIFGCGLAASLALISLLLSITGHETNPVPLFFGTLVFLTVLWWPAGIVSMYNAWVKLLLALFTTLLTLFWVFYILPMGLIMQARGIDPLNRYFQPRTKTYWQAPLPITDMQKQR